MKRKYRVGFYVEVEVESYNDEEAWLVASTASNWPFPGGLPRPVRKEGYLNDIAVSADIVRAQPLMTKPVEEE